ncbi:MAG: 3-keto-5-aminohexanoate cleavage protein [Chrysiogenetes bacterium]|nr:3-keto-5-aminohexanoate cleavage protein [Chrysiogenetes bacterium]
MSELKDKCVISCALTGVLTDPGQFPVPVTPEEMAKEARAAFDAGATIVHCHFRSQKKGMGRLPSWEPEVAKAICDAIKEEVPEILINMSTGMVGPNIQGPLDCLEAVKPELAALNAGTLNYLKTRANGAWAWPPMVFDNPVDKIKKYLEVMDKYNIIPECECFDTGIVRSVGLYLHNGMMKSPVHISLVMGVASGMPCKPEWLPLLVAEMPEGTEWQTIGIGREEVWAVHRKAAELGGQVRTGLEDTFYLPDGNKATSNGQLVEALANIVRESGREPASPAEARQICGVPS